MLILFKFFGGIISTLNSDDSPKQLGCGFAYGALIGLIPLKGLLPPVLGFLSFLININLGFVALAGMIFKLLGFLVDPIANQIGFVLLTKVPALHPFWTKLYNMPIVPYTRFNNTIVLGSVVLGLVLLVPNYFLGKRLVGLYRAHFRDKVEQFRIMKLIKASKFYQYYETYRGIRGG